MHPAANGMAGAFISCLLLGCASGGTPASRETVSALIRKYESARRIGCERREFAGWQTDMKCVADRQKKIATLVERIRAQHAADLATAPECLRQFTVPEEVLKKEGIDADSPDAIADLLSRGYLLSSVMRDRACVSEVCRWRTGTDPERAAAFCP
jgi:hypothetical protein